jgi:hypothetical protein
LPRFNEYSNECSMENKKIMNNLEIPKACIRKQHGYVLLDSKNRKAYRMLSSQSYNYVTSKSYKKMAGKYWPSVIDCKEKNKENFFKVEVEYIDHPFYWTEMSFLDIKKSLLFLCDISEYLAKENMHIVSHLWNVVIVSGQPLLIDIGDFRPGKEKLAIFETITSTLSKISNHHVPEGYQPSFWIKNHSYILDSLKEIKEEASSDLIDAESLILKIKNIILDININVDSHDWDDYPVQLNTPNDVESIKKHAEHNRPNLCKIIKENSSITNTLLDLGCSRGLYSFYAAAHNIVATGADYSHTLIKSANEKSVLLNLKTQFSYLDLLNIKSWGLNGVYESCLNRFKSDGVIAPALIHHVHGRGKDLKTIIKEWSSCSKKWIIIEYIPADTLGNTIDHNVIISTLKEDGYSNIEILESKPSPRKWIYAYEKK